MLSSVFDWEKKFRFFLVFSNGSKSLKNDTDKGTKHGHLSYKLSYDETNKSVSSSPSLLGLFSYFGNVS